ALSPPGAPPPDPPGPGNPPYRRRAVSEARQDGGAGRRHLERGVRDLEQVAAPARAVLDRPDPVSALRFFLLSRRILKARQAARHKRTSPSAPARVSGPVRFVLGTKFP